MTTVAATQFLPVMAVAGAAKDFLVVSVHDVAPSNRHIVEPILARLTKLGVFVSSLLVVPDYHQQHPIAAAPEFLSWLRNLQADGHEIVIHGYFHLRPPRGPETMRDRFITSVYTQGEGEFFDLDYNEAFRRITAARDLFTESGLKPRGFIAPAWLLSADGERAARDAGLDYTTRLRSVVDLQSGESFRARSLVYSVHSGWRRGLSLLWNDLLGRVAQEKALVRLSIHPPDYAFPAIWAQIERFISKMGELRTATTYRDWIAEQRVKGKTPHE
jgi:predicted deacetylase